MDCSADQEIQTWNTLASASFREALAQDLSNQDGPSAYYHLPTSLHLHTHSSAALTDATSEASRDPALAARLSLHLPCLLREIVPKSSCRSVIAPPSTSSSCAVLAMPLSHGSLYDQLHHSGWSSGGQELAEGMLWKCVIRPGGWCC